ncbi:pyridoxamine 5'-phosphate oxidase family protein [Desulfovibrio sp. SGI.169]|uniref:pyridoxamine 5'-phosphate oxidase family protein n=1 Tax=Desulfovibrio sp. SGI.169 TaxID=3420561 RepID=UPI003D05A93D
MRLSKRECSEPAFFDEVFSGADELFLALNNGDFPYLIPLNFVRLGQRIYMHCAPEGTKLDLIRRDGRVAFSLTTDVRIDREKSSTYYKSVCGTGRACVVEDPAEKRLALDSLAERYAALCPRPAPESAVRRVGVIRIDILSLTGKRCLPKGESGPDSL